MPNYQAKDASVLRRQLKVQSLAIPLTVVANVTPASKTVSNDEPALLFSNFEGLTGITLANGAVDSSAELAAITFATATDTTGVYNLLLRVNEPIEKIVSAEVHKTNVSGAAEILCCSYPTGATSGISSVGDKMVFNLDSAVNFASTNYTATLVVRYVAQE